MVFSTILFYQLFYFIIYVGVQQLDVRVETKTKDNVFLTAVVSVQYQVVREKAYQAFYALTNTRQQITAHIYDVVRSQLPTLDLDAVFEAKEDLALAVKNALHETMSGYGYQILQALITDIDPDQRVKNAMNEINSAKRLKFAVAEKAEGQKILQVKSAEAEAEAKYLSGVGVAKQRKAIVDGLRNSIVDFSGNIKDGRTPTNNARDSVPYSFVVRIILWTGRPRYHTMTEVMCIVEAQTAKPHDFTKSHTVLGPSCCALFL